MRRWYRDHLLKQLAARSTEVSVDELRLDAVVFSPHPDDETLACGGTILRKHAAGARVQVVVMTDGSQSHSQFMPAPELAALRQDEVREACKRLGVKNADLHLLGFEDEHLAQHQEQAAKHVTDLLQRIRPAEIYVPYRHEPPEDHVTTSHIVSTAVAAMDLEFVVREYPVWAWDCWPWTAARARLRGLVDVKRSFPRNRRLLDDLTTHVDISEHLDRKRAALAAYASQTTRLEGNRWPILTDVSAGEFLDCLMQPREYFHTHGVPS